MCDEPRAIDDIIVFEYDNDCDSVDGDEFQAIEEQHIDDDEEEEEQEPITDDTTDQEFVLPTHVEALENEEILQEHMLPSIDVDEVPELLDIKPDINEDNCTFLTDALPAVKKPVGPARYLLFDDLIANVVDYDDDNTPIVQFSMPDAETDNSLPVECGICPDVMRKELLPKHLKTHLVPGANRYQCIYCDETYKDYKYLASHARRHMGIRPYVCEICKLYFSTKQDMRVHNQRRHQEKEHICEICGKTFSQNTMLKRHRESTHEKKRRFQCEHCPKAYYKNFSLQEHVRSVHMGQRRMLKCPFCGMQCRDAHKMARHRKLWHLNQKHFECEICQEKFTNVHYFDAHKRSIQCRNNTRRQQEQDQQQQDAGAFVENAEELPDEEIEEEQAQLEAEQADLQWKYEEPESADVAVEEEVYATEDTFVELVMHDQELIQGSQEFFQDGDMIFEITQHPDSN